MSRAAFFLALFSVLAWGKKAPPRDPSMAVVRQSAGEVRSLDKDTSVAAEVKLGDVIASGRTLVTGENGLLVLRFHPDFGRIEARAKTRFLLGYSRADSAKPRRIRLDEGQLVFGIPKQSPSVQAEDTHSRLKADNARFSFASDPKIQSTIVVLDGAVEVHNRSKDITSTVRRGQKAVSDVDGLRVSDASDGELEQVGLRQNVMEVDFWNPENEEFSTLEVEYESNF